MNTASQNAAILARLQRGDTITPLDAFNDPGIRSMRLAARIFDLRQQGHDIEAVTVDLNDGSNMKTVAGYRLRLRMDGAQRVFA